MMDLNALAIVIGPLAAAAAKDSDTAGKPNILQALLPLILIFFVFYFLIIRPQSKRRRQRLDMLGTVKKGDKVVTTGGIRGVVTLVRDTDVVVKVDDNVKLTFVKSGIARIESPEAESGRQE